jgi:hypothetical protein
MAKPWQTGLEYDFSALMGAVGPPAKGGYFHHYTLLGSGYEYIKSLIK